MLFVYGQKTFQIDSFPEEKKSKLSADFLKLNTETCEEFNVNVSENYFLPLQIMIEDEDKNKNFGSSSFLFSRSKDTYIGKGLVEINSQQF